MTKSKELTNARQSTHGDWDEGAAISEGIMDILTAGTSWGQMTPGMRQSARMIVHKLHRIVTGNPTVLDHWEDIGGYAELVARKLRPMQLPGPTLISARTRPVARKAGTKGKLPSRTKAAPRPAVGKKAHGKPLTPGEAKTLMTIGKATQKDPS